MEWDEKQAKYLENEELGILVEVDVRSPLPFSFVHSRSLSSLLAFSSLRNSKLVTTS